MEHFAAGTVNGTCPDDALPHPIAIAMQIHPVL